MKKKQKLTWYETLVEIPDFLYPFSYKARGKRIRGLRSYNHELHLALKKYGKGHFGYKLIAYRETFHFIGSVLFIVFSAVLSERLFGSEVALYVLLVSAIIAVTYQEFYVHPKKYGQLLKKGFIDWFAWVLPIGIFLFTHTQAL